MSYPSQAFVHESSKVGGRRKDTKRDRKDRGQEADGKKGSKKKTFLGTKTGPNYNTAQVHIAGGGTLNFPLATECDPLPP